MSSSCPICYESFLDVHPRRLFLCGDIVCASCIDSELEQIQNKVFYCPQCGKENINCNNIDDICKIVESSLFAFKASDDTDILRVSDDLSVTEAKGSISRNSINGDSYSSNSETEQEVSNDESSNHRKDQLRQSVSLRQPYRMRKSMIEVEKIANDMMNNHDLRFFSISSGSNILQMDEKTVSKSTNPEVLLSKFRSQQRIELGEALDIILKAKAILSREKNILNLDAPVIVVGDIHGQFFDLLNILEESKQLHSSMSQVDVKSQDAWPDFTHSHTERHGINPNNTYLFLGDYVDRGYYSCEVMLYLLSLKIMYPDKIWLLRGNHECASVSGHFGFKEECKLKYGVNIYYSFLLLFQTMPLAAVISTAFGDIYACHGGLSPTILTLEDIEQIDRLVEPESNMSLMDILWADPLSDEGIAAMSKKEYQDFIEIDWKPNPARGCSYCYGYKAVKDFLKKNNLVCLVRAHEVQEEGFRKHFEPSIMEQKVKKFTRNVNRKSYSQDVDEEQFINSLELTKKRSYSLDVDVSSPRSCNSPLVSLENIYSVDKQVEFKEPDEFPPVITIFSAPNYCNRYQNKGAVLFIDSALDGFRVIQYECVDHPKPEIVESQNTNLIQAILATCPYMPTSFRNFVRLAVELGDDECLTYDEIDYNDINIEDENESNEDVNTDIDNKVTINQNENCKPLTDIIEVKSIKHDTGSKNIIIDSNFNNKTKTISLIRSLKNNDKTDEIDSETKSSLNIINENSDDETTNTIQPTFNSPAFKDNKNNIEADRKRMINTRGITRGGITPRANKYIQAFASDSINEVHPEKLTDFIKKNFKNVYEESSKKEFQFTLFKLSNDEKPEISISDLKLRYENKLSSRFSESKSSSTISFGEIIRESDRCTEIAALQKKFGGIGKMKIVSPRSPPSDKDSVKKDNNNNGSYEKKKNYSLQDPIFVEYSPNKTIIEETLPNVEYELKVEKSISFEVIKDDLLDNNKNIKNDKKYNNHKHMTQSLGKVDPEIQNENLHIGSISNIDISSVDLIVDEKDKKVDSVLFSQSEIMGLRLLFSLFDRSGSCTIEYDDLVAYAEETGDMMGIRDAATALEILDIDGDSKIGLLDFIHFARRLKAIHQSIPT